ncbi:Triose-phosphate Transporter family protein [Poseidonocella pacifica]|uniref:Triose-phosphate Transporter family protein n=1 Tax=Poseidonocella pacifica TaxID=871651 RepID=A0A1I0VAZ0_9RHOB|nr:DMT family transporter [Poseidonocella pacifica]SFA73418.1 Triose-phosphate Transporter family protein [Poseidonocella pacifica]
MSHHPRFGLLLALFGALVLTPDTLLMRLSDMSGAQMIAWRGLSLGSVMLVLWVTTSRAHRREIGTLRQRATYQVVICQYLNAILFSLAIAVAPVAVVLVSIATAPVFAAVIGRVLYGDPAGRATWIAMTVVLAGIAIAVFGEDHGGSAFGAGTLLGALAGLSVAGVLAFNFTLLRHNSDIPLPLVIGIGSLLSGMTGLFIVGPAGMGDGHILPILLAGAVIAPLAFGTLSLASRHTHAANVSLLMLLETVLGPLVVWWGVGEAPGPWMLIGGGIVVGSLAVYMARALLVERAAAS